MEVTGAAVVPFVHLNLIWQLLLQIKFLQLTPCPFCSAVVLEGTAMSLCSKVMHPSLASGTWNAGDAHRQTFPCVVSYLYLPCRKATFAGLQASSALRQEQLDACAAIFCCLLLPSLLATPPSRSSTILARRCLVCWPSSQLPAWAT